ncbi:uncharacterized protein LOC106667315 [Cimex lectularius]|uniref:Uncharacterized protein n=1 Tax=Cimex lectularius TaxID=79782 RepID=A0A8I6THY8_CIMLE|nr:uncharacterized protein LOC106667315 [Cimex lectularius]
MGNVLGHLGQGGRLRLEEDEKNLETPPRSAHRSFLEDPRSATIGIKRTPITVLQYRKLDSKSQFDAADSFQEDECEEEDSANQTSISEIEISIENLEITNGTSEESEDPAVDRVEDDAQELNVQCDAKPAFHTPQPMGKILEKTGRTPLGQICTNSPFSLKGLNDGKSWKGIREERLRRGINDPENTPPHMLIPSNEVQSAPGKFLRKPLLVWTDDN